MRFSTRDLADLATAALLPTGLATVPQTKPLDRRVRFRDLFWAGHDEHIIRLLSSTRLFLSLIATNSGKETFMDRSQNILHRREPLAFGQ